jgi:hypothetical protein
MSRRMNFLSHFYLHKDNSDNHFTVGLTIPDVVGFHSRKIRLTKRTLREAGANIKDKDIRSCIAGMITHIMLDTWFHNSEFFKENVTFLEDKYRDYNSAKDKLMHFYAHITLEIFIDKYLLGLEPDIADRFYGSYQMFDFERISQVFHKMRYFEKDKFVYFAESTANSSFLKEYIHDDMIMSILKRVSNRINIPFMITANEEEFRHFVRDTYKELQGSFGEFLKIAKEENPVIKEEIIESFNVAAIS